MQPLLCARWVSAVNRRSLGGDAALAAGPLGRPQAGSYVVSTRWLVGARLRATRWILLRRRRVCRGAMVDAASSLRSLRSLRLCGESKVAWGRRGACVRYAGTIRWVARKRAPTSLAPVGLSEPACGRRVGFTAETQSAPGRWPSRNHARSRRGIRLMWTSHCSSNPERIAAGISQVNRRRRSIPVVSPSRMRIQ
jgi:hypothetical protein